MESSCQLRTLEDGFADDAFAFAEEYAEFFQACEQWRAAPGGSGYRWTTPLLGKWLEITKDPF